MDIKTRSIPSKSRYSDSRHKDLERRQRLMSKQFKEIQKDYKGKEEQLRGVIVGETKELQGLSEEKEGYIQEVNYLGKEKGNLNISIDNLQDKKAQENKNLENIIESKRGIIEKAKNIGREERTKIESAKVFFNKEVQETRDKLEKELKQRVKVSKVVLEGVQSNIKHLEQEKTSLISSNADTVKEGRLVLENIQTELSDTKKTSTSYKEKSEKEVITLVSEKKEWVDKVSELRRQADLAKGLISLEQEVERRTGLLNSSVQSIEKDIQVLNSERLDLLENKVKDKNEAEIRKIEIRDEIKGLEEVIRVSKQLQNKETNVLEIRRIELLRQQGDIEKDIIETNRVLKSEKEKTHSLIKAKRKEQEYEQEKLDLTKRSLGEVTGQLAGLEKIATELKDYADKEGDAREKYQIEQGKLDRAQIKYEKVSSETSKKEQEIQEKNTQLSEYQENVKELSGQLTTTLRYVREVTETINERLEQEGIPLKRRIPLPPKQIQKIPF